MISREEDVATVIWLEEQLEQASGRGQVKLADLLTAVRDDIMLELTLTERLLVNR